MKEGQKKGYTLSVNGLVADRVDGKVLYFYHEHSKTEEFVDDLSGARLKEGDQIYLAPPDRIVGPNLQKYQGKTLRQQLRMRRNDEPDRDVFLAYGVRRHFEKGEEIESPQEVNILILRKKSSTP